MNQKLLKLSIFFILLGLLATSAYNIGLAYSKPLTKTITENHLEEVQRVE